MGRILQMKWVRSLLLAALLVGAYALLGFKVAPGMVRNQAIAFVKKEYGRDLAIGAVRVNPFLLQLEIRDFSLPDADGSAMVGFRRLFLDFEASSLWKRAWFFKEVALEAPQLHAVIRPGGAVNLADLSPKEPPPPQGKEPGNLPSVWLERFVVSDGVIAFADRNRASPFERRLSPVRFTLENFHTTSEGGGFRLAAKTNADEGFEWTGHFEVAPAIASRGAVAIHGLRAAGVSEYLGDTLPFEIDSGLIDIAGQYDVSLANGVAATVNLPTIDVTGLGIRARGVDEDWVQIPGITITDTDLSLPARSVKIASIAVIDMSVQAWTEPDGAVNLQSLFVPGAVSGQPSSPEPASAAQPDTAQPSNAPDNRPPQDGARPPSATIETTEGSAPQWQVQVATTELRNATIDFEDRQKGPAKKFLVAPLNIRVSDASLDLGKPVPVSLDCVVNGVAPFKADGAVTPSPLAADLAISLSGARMSILQPYVLPIADLTITDGRLTVEGDVKLEPPTAAGPDLSFDGQVTIDNFASIDNALKRDLVNFKRVEVRKLSFAKSPDSVRIDSVLVRQPFARVIVSPDRVINIAAVLDPEGTKRAVAERRAAAAAEAAMTPAQKRERERRREAAEKQAAAERKTGRATTPAMPPLPAEGMPIRIRTVRVEHGSLDFTDDFVQPHFSARIQDLQGGLAGLSSDPRTHATVDFKGNVGEFSPVTIEGEVQPFAFERYADINLHFANISLPIFNPYSGQFAGYAIDKGKLTTDLHYLIQDRKLDAKHHIQIEQLEWGEQTAKQGEATLPVKFATVLLRDADGVINLDIPVTGTLDDPQFRIGPIIWQVIKNLIVKAVTAPFKLLGALFAGAEEAQFIDFAPGSAELDAQTTERLAALAKSLQQKPGLRLEVPIGALPELDEAALRDNAFRAALEQAMGASLGKRAAEGRLPTWETLEPDRKIDVLTTLVTGQTGTKPKLPEPPEPPEGTSRKDAKAMEQAADIEFLEATARANVSVPDGAVGNLAEQRAEAVQHALLSDGALDPARVFEVKDGKVTQQDGKVRFQLELK